MIAQQRVEFAFRHAQRMVAKECMLAGETNSRDGDHIHGPSLFRGEIATSGVEQPMTACCDRMDHTDSTKLDEAGLTDGGWLCKRAETRRKLCACANGVAKQTKRAH